MYQAATFGVLNVDFQRRQVGFHLSDLPDRFLYSEFVYATYQYADYLNQSFQLKSRCNFKQKVKYYRCLAIKCGGFFN